MIMHDFDKPIYRIYSRKRLRLNYIRNIRNKKNDRYYRINIKKFNKAFPYIVLLIALIIIFNTIWRAITPVFDSLAKDEAKKIATKLTNEEISKIMEKCTYDTFFNIDKDLNGKIQMISANVLRINQITSDIAINIQNSLRNDDENNINISIGSLSGVKMLAGIGPKIPIKLNSVGNVETNLKSEFISQGVNQTLHRVYLEVTSTVDILTPFSTLSESINNQVLILENVILGEIPSNYYDFDGINSSNQALEVIE